VIWLDLPRIAVRNGVTQILDEPICGAATKIRRVDAPRRKGNWLPREVRPYVCCRAGLRRIFLLRIGSQALRGPAQNGREESVHGTHLVSWMRFLQHFAKSLHDCKLNVFVPDFHWHDPYSAASSASSSSSASCTHFSQVASWPD
jgi:hypothetical protein